MLDFSASPLELLRASQEFPEVKSSTVENLFRLSVEVKSFIFRTGTSYDVINVSGMKEAFRITIQILLQVIPDRCLQQKRAWWDSKDNSGDLKTRMLGGSLVGSSTHRNRSTSWSLCYRNH